MEMATWIDTVAKTELDLGLATHTAKIALDQAIDFIERNIADNPDRDRAVIGLMKTRLKISEKLSE